jgi:hypothetical protein
MPLSVRSISQKIRPPALTRLENTSLVPLLLGLSQFVNDRVAHSRRMANGMALRGSHRLQTLQAAGPRLRESIEQILMDGTSSRLRQTAEEMAFIQALIEFCLGWMLYLLEQISCPRATYSAFNPRWAASLGSSFPWSDAGRQIVKCPTPA